MLNGCARTRNTHLESESRGAFLHHRADSKGTAAPHRASGPGARGRRKGCGAGKPSRSPHGACEEKQKPGPIQDSFDFLGPSSLQTAGGY